MTSQTGTGEGVDGRRRRADENRGRIVEAMIALIREGGVAPGAEQVADRAGVGLRTVFRLFRDMDGLYREMHARILLSVRPILAEPLPDVSWREQLRHLVARRARVFEHILPIKTVADSVRVRSSFLTEEHARFVRLQRETLFAAIPASARQGAARAAALDLVASFEAWRRLRHDQGLGPQSAERAVMAALNALLD